MRINPIETFEQPECSLFAEIAKGNGLKQPTNSKFSAAKWIECFNNINEPTQDDERLLRSAIWIADRVQNLRDTFTQIVFNCDRSNLTKLIAAYTNSIHIIYSRKFHDFHESEYSKAGIVNVTSVTQQPMKAEAANQSIEPDHFFTSVIDSLPHILFHSMKANGKLKVVPFEGIQSLVLLGNLEVIFNDCWQKVLWEGFDIELEENLIRLVPPEERNLCWSLWEYRKSNLVIESLHAVGFGHFKHFEAADFSKHMPAYFPSSCKKVSNTRIQFLYQKPSPKKVCYRVQASWITLIKDAYLAGYLDKNIDQADPTSPTFFDVVTVFNLIHAGLEARLEIVESKIDEKSLNANLASFYISKMDLGTMLRKCCNLTQKNIEQIVDFLSIRVDKTNDLFNFGLFPNPLLIDEAASGYFQLSAPIFVGNPVRTFELWMAKAGYTDKGEIRGAEFETAVAQELTTIAEETDLTENIKISRPSIEIHGEEIDLLVQIHDRLIVIEAKSYITPGDPIDRYNTIKKLRHGATQAQRKAKMIKNDFQGKFAFENIVLDHVEEVLPLLLTSSPYGTGLSFNGVPVVDASFFEMLLGGKSYMSVMAQNSLTGEIVKEETHLYPMDKFSFSVFWRHVCDPFVQHKYAKSLAYRFEPVPCGIPDTEFLIPFPTFQPEDNSSILKMLDSKR